MRSISEHELDKLGEEFSARLRRGEKPLMSEYTERFAPESAAEIEELLESIEMLESMKPTQKPAAKEAESFPRDFGRYRIESSLGEGGMGTVYLAHDSQLDRKVALKTPKFTQNSDPNLMARFDREAKSAATLRHPNICPVYDVGQIDGIHYISMAYIEGRPLSDYIHSGKVPSVSNAIRIVRKVALALHEAHTNGLIHRDLKPANIMIDGRNEPIVMDFGLARQFKDAGISSSSMPVLSDLKQSHSQPNFEARLTQEGTVVGSPGYMSPEQLTGDHAKIGPTSDVYALGSMFYELLTGRLPFPGDGSLISIVNAVLTEPPPNASAVRSAVDSRTAKVCRRAMAKKTDDRFQSMQTFAVALTGLLKSKDETSKDNPSDELSVKTTSSDLVRTKEQYELSKSLYQEGQFAAAASIMEKMIDTAGQPNQFTTWAGKQLSKAKAKAHDTTAQEVTSKTNELGDEFWDVNVQEPDISLSKRSATRTQKANRGRKQSQKTKAAVAATGIAAIVLVAFMISRYPSVRNTPVTHQPAVAAASNTKQKQPKTLLPKDDVDFALGDTPLVNKTGVNTTGVDTKDIETASDTPDANSRSRRLGSARQTITERIWRLDTNDDGKLSQTELTKIRPLQGGPVNHLISQFERFDNNPKDGLLDSREVLRLMRSMPRLGNGRDNAAQGPGSRRRSGQ